MARIELRNTTIRFRDGYSNTAAVNEAAPAAGDTTLGVDTLGTSGVIPVTSRFTIVGSTRTYTVTATNGNAVLTIDLGGSTGGTFTVSVAGNASTTIAYNAIESAIQSAVDAITGVDPGDFEVAKSGDDITVTALTGGQFANEAVTLSANTASLTGGTPASSQTAAGGVSTEITFTPALATADGIPTDDAVITFGGRSCEVKVGDGNCEYTEARQYTYDLDRGRLDTVRRGDDVPMAVSLDFVWEELTAIDGAEVPTPSDVLHRRGPAADWVSSSADQCEDYAIDIEIENIPPCGNAGTEYVLLPDFRWESLPHSLSDAQIAMTGQCNATEAIVTRPSA